MKKDTSTRLCVSNPRSLSELGYVCVRQFHRLFVLENWPPRHGEGFAALLEAFQVTFSEAATATVIHGSILLSLSRFIKCNTVVCKAKSADVWNLPLPFNHILSVVNIGTHILFGLKKVIAFTAIIVQFDRQVAVPAFESPDAFVHHVSQAPAMQMEKVLIEL